MSSGERGTSRRSFLRGAAALAGGGVLASTAGCLELLGLSDRPGIGGELAASGGAGAQYAYEQPQVTPAHATHEARTPEELIAGIDAGEEGAPSVVWVPADAAIDMTGRPTVDVEFSTIASPRSVNHPGGIIYTNTQGENTSQYAGGGVFDFKKQSRMTGLRFRGPTSAVFDGNPRISGYIPKPSWSSKSRRYEFYGDNAARGLTISHGEVQIDNCELYGWSRMAIYCDCPRSYQRDQEQSYPLINNISGHNNLMDSSGYVVEVIRGHPFIRKCYFDANRHSVAGFGYPDAGFTIDNCYFGKMIGSFPVDMHYLGENAGSGSSPDDYKFRYRGGELMRVLNSTFACLDVFEASVVSPGGRQPACALQGVPLEGSEVRGNVFRHGPPGSGSGVFSQGHTGGMFEDEKGPNGFVRWTIEDNTYNWEPDFPSEQQNQQEQEQ